MLVRLKYRELDYNRCTRNVVVTDIPLTNEDAVLELNENIMVKCIKSLKDAKEKLLRIRESENVQTILLIFECISKKENFDRELKKLCQTVKQKFSNVKMILSLHDKLALGKSMHEKLIKSGIEVDSPDRPLTDEKELKKHIERRFKDLKLFLTSSDDPRSRNPEYIAAYLRIRCKPTYKFQYDPGSVEDFVIENGRDKLHFVFKKTYYSVYNYALREKMPFITLKAGYLLGLYNFKCLFKIVNLLHNFLKDYRVALVNGKLVFIDKIPNNAELVNENSSFIFSYIISVFNEYSDIFSSKKFKIQLGPNNNLVFNRRLIISLSHLGAIFKSDNQPVQFISDLVKLSLKYFKCFSTAPSCCRMQSLDPEAIVYDFEKFTYHHININRSRYIRMCKLFFSYIAEVDDEMLQQKYLEIMPVTLIQRFHGSKLEHFIEKLQLLRTNNISIIPLPNGHFQVGKNSVISAADLCTWCVDPENGDVNIANAALSTFSAALLERQEFWTNQDESLLFTQNFPQKIDYTVFNEIMSRLLNFISSEGIYMVLRYDRIDTFENSDIVGHGPEYDAILDNCYYNEKDLISFIRYAKNSDLISLTFEVTSCGLIRFQNSISISPTTFLRVKNTKNLMEIIAMLCVYKSEKEISIPRAWSCNKKNLRNKDQIVEIAKLLNPQLANLEINDFMLKNFSCLSRIFEIIREIKFLYKLLKNLRKLKIKAINSTSQDYTLETDRCELMYFIESEFSLTNFVQTLKNLEQINEKFDGFVYVLHPNFNIYKGNRVLQENNYEIDADAVQNFTTLFKEHNVKNVTIEENERLLVNRSLSIHSQDLSKLDSAAFKLFLEIAAFFNDEKRFDHWISLAKERKSHHSLKNKKFLQFTIAEHNKEIYLKLVKVLTPSLEHISDEDILSFEWLEVLPSHLLMDKRSLKKLLKIVIKLKRHGHQIFCDHYGIHTSLIVLLVKMWLQLDENNTEKFTEFFNCLATMLPANSPSGCYPNLTISGKLCIPREATSNFSSIIRISEFFKKLSIFNEDRKYPITIVSEGKVMLGNYIWVKFYHVFHMVNKFFLLVQLFEDSVKPENPNLMKSINKLKNKEKAIHLVKTMNEDLIKFTDRMICSKTLRILPTQLWKACNENKEMYEKAIELFEALKKEKILWYLQLNGNIKLGIDVIIISVLDLIALNDNPESLKEKMKLLKELIDKMKKYRFLQLTCLDEVEYIKEKEPKIWSTKASSLNDLIKLKKQLSKCHKIRIEPNGTFIINEHLWMKPEDVEQYDALKLSEMTKTLFPTSKFQFGNPLHKIYASLTNSPNEQLYEYCRNICQYVQEDGGISIKYLVEKNMLEFNGALLIHPRSFTHLQDIEKVVEFLKEYGSYGKRREEFENKKNGMSKKEIQIEENKLKKEEEELYKKFATIKKEERIELEMLKEILYQKLYEIIQNPQVNSLFKNIPKIDEKDPQKYYYALKDLQIQGQFIFQKGGSLGFISFDNGKIKYEYTNKNIIDALLIADKLDKKYKCKNLFEFQSLIEIVRAFPTFEDKNLAKIPEEINGFPSHEQINWWLEEVQKEQEKPNRKHKFYNALKGLHHWFKHPDGFENLQDYYVKMNEFFDTSNYVSELDYQNGQFISRHYDNKVYTGYYGIAFEESGNENYVASFWSLAPKVKSKIKTASSENGITLKYQKENPDATYLVITDTDLSCFKADEQVCLNEKIIVKTPSMAPPDLLKLHKSIKGATYGTMEKVLFFLPQTLKNKIIEKIPKKTAKGKEFDQKEIDFSTGFNDFTKLVEEKFSGTKVIVCYPFDMDSDNLEIMKQNSRFELVEIQKSLMEEKNAVEIKNFIESKLSID